MCEKFDMEYYLQQLTNKHLEYLFGLKFVTAEYQLPGLEDDSEDFDDEVESDKKTKSLRIDGLAFNNETKSFVIIEYKNKLDENVIDQAESYYENLLEKKGCYVKKYNEIFGRHCTEDDFDFSKTRVMIIGPEFNQEQEERAKNPDYPFELYTVCLCKYNDKISHVSYKKIHSDSKKVLYFSSEDLIITRCSLLENKSDEVKELYNDFENRLFEQFDNDFILNIKYIVDAVSIKAHNKYICRLRVNKNSIKIHFYNDELDDKALEHDGICDAIKLIKQVYSQKVGK